MRRRHWKHDASDDQHSICGVWVYDPEGGTIVKMYETDGEYFMWDLVYERVHILPVAI